jgi:hypothetical protein
MYRNEFAKGLEKVNGEMSLIMTDYNFRRVMNIFKFDELLGKLKNWKPDDEKVIRTLFKTDFMSSKMAMSIFSRSFLFMKFRIA